MYPVGHLSTMYWLVFQGRRHPPLISSPGWAKHAWSCFFAPWIAEATIFVYSYGRFDARFVAAEIRDEHVTSFCAPPTRCGGC
jgi:acetyl-CoA synthetase